MVDAPKIPLIIDTDPGVDDVLAILLALASPEITLKAITLTFGNTTLDHAESNIYRTGLVLRKHLLDSKTPADVKERFSTNFGEDSSEIKVAVGAEGPLGGKRFTAGYLLASSACLLHLSTVHSLTSFPFSPRSSHSHGRDGLSSISTLPSNPFPTTSSSHSPHPFKSVSLSSCDQILKTLSEEPIHTVRIAAIGPLTNIAMAFQKDPETFSRLGSLSIMGGSLDGCGNTTPVAEFNFFADPLAAKIIMEDAPVHPVFSGPGKRGLKSFLLPLDITERHVVPYSNMVKTGQDLKNSGILGEFISALLTHPRKVTNNYVSPSEFDPKKHDLFQAHDPLAVAHAIFSLQSNPQNIPGTETEEEGKGWKVSSREFQVEWKGDITRGMCVVDRRNHGNQGDKNKAKQNQKNEEKEDGKVEKNGKRNDEEGESPLPVTAVTESPGIEWFSKVFTERLGF